MWKFRWWKYTITSQNLEDRILMQTRSIGLMQNRTICGKSGVIYLVKIDFIM